MSIGRTELQVMYLITASFRGLWDSYNSNSSDCRRTVAKKSAWRHATGIASGPAWNCYMGELFEVLDDNGNPTGCLKERKLVHRDGRHLKTRNSQCCHHSSECWFPCDSSLVSIHHENITVGWCMLGWSVLPGCGSLYHFQRLIVVGLQTRVASQLWYL